MPVPYIERTTARFSAQGFPPYKWSQNDDVPLTKMTKPLKDANIAVVSSSGVYLPDQEAFNPVRDDMTFREIPLNIAQKDVLISHNNYDHTDAEKDVNCVIPLNALKQLQQDGEIGSVNEPIMTFMGRVMARTAFIKEMAPWLHKKFVDEKVDAVLLIPV